MLNRSDSLEGMTKQANRGETVHVIIITLAGMQGIFILAFEKHFDIANCYGVHTARCTIGQSIERQGVWARNGDFIWKASRLRRWWTSVPKCPILPQVGVLSFFYRAKMGR